MSGELGRYSFLPWLRTGVANQITAKDADPAVTLRATVPVTVRVTGKPISGNGSVQDQVSRQVQLYGPGDIVGLDPRAIVRTEPRHWVTNFEANYLAAVDFYDEDFPWRYTPSAPLDGAASRLRPWLALVVLAEEEFTDVAITGQPLPTIVVGRPEVLPPLDQSWAWAHVHVNRPLAADPSTVSVPAAQNADLLNRFAQTLAENADLAYSRLLSPRKLAPDTAYHAFIVPAFETGRLAGLGLDPTGAPHATHGAWAAYPSGTRPEPDQYPVYHRWYFHTGTVGDFEYLVRLIQPRAMDSRVGRRDVDVQAPGANLPGIADLGGVLKLGGALQVPAADLTESQREEVAAFDHWDQPYPHPFQRRLAELINLASAYQTTTVSAAHAAAHLDLGRVPDDPDPLVVPPLYGRWHALTDRLLFDRAGLPVANADNWVHELNLDPRWRIAAGFGSGVVRENQEAYMAAAWDQIGAVVEANRQIRWAQLAVAVSNSWRIRHLVGLATSDPERFLAMTAPVDARIAAGGTTRRYGQRASRVPRAVLSAPMRRITRVGGTALGALTDQGSRAPAVSGLLARLNDGAVVAAPPKVTPPALPTVNQLADLVGRSGPQAHDGPAGRVYASPTTAGAALRPDVSGSIRILPGSPDFEVVAPGIVYTPPIGDHDSVTATRFKQGLIDSADLFAMDPPPPAAPPAWDLAAVTAQTLAALDVTRTIPSRVRGRIHIPTRLRDRVGPDFGEVSAYPEFNLPMYQPLAAMSAELFLPNLQYIPDNCISLLETNQRFIEAYLVGLNDAMGRELLWREYPTDQRGSYFRQFWNVNAALPPAGVDPAVVKENHRDIPPIDRWIPPSRLGQHNNRPAPDPSGEDLVLVIRGELLKKYPTAVILAHRAQWQRTATGQIDKTVARQLVPLTDAEAADPPAALVRTPRYDASVDPDIYLFGFDLTAEQARGETVVDPDDPGWFFVIKQRPGEPRFGLDLDSAGAVRHYWDDAAWSDVMPGLADGGFLSALAAPAFGLTPPALSAPPEQQRQYSEDRQIRWDATVTSADLAYVLYQVPVLVAVHASRMLRQPGGGDD